MIRADEWWQDGFSWTRQRVRNWAKRRSSTAKSRALTTSCAFCWSFVSDFFPPCRLSQSTDDCLLCLGGARDIEARASLPSSWVTGNFQRLSGVLFPSQTYQMSIPGPQSWSSFLDPILKKPRKTIASHSDRRQMKPAKLLHFVVQKSCKR